MPVVPPLEHAPALGAPAAPVPWLTALADLLFPPFCPLCRGRLGQGRRDPLCGGCWEGLERIASPVCRLCGLPLPRFAGADEAADGGDHACGACRRRPPGYAYARAAARYGDLVRDAIHALKFRGRRGLAAPLGDLLAEAAGRHLAGRRIDVLVAVPLHRRRERERGFNQAELLARRLSAVSRIPLAPRVLGRRIATTPQTELTAPERWANVRDAFVLRRPQAVQGRHVLLVDDLMTTGATAGACAACLERGGAASVGLLTVARVV